MLIDLSMPNTQNVYAAWTRPPDTQKCPLVSRAEHQ